MKQGVYKYKNGIKVRLHNKMVTVWKDKNGNAGIELRAILPEGHLGFNGNKIRGKMKVTGFALTSDALEALCYCLNYYYSMPKEQNPERSVAGNDAI